jgi:hypothetical protein
MKEEVRVHSNLNDSWNAVVLKGEKGIHLDFDEMREVHRKLGELIAIQDAARSHGWGGRDP